MEMLKRLFRKKMKVISQQTPNPNALKFVAEKDMKADGKITVSDPQQALTVPLVTSLFNIEGVTQLHFFENSISVTKNNDVPWDIIESQIVDVIEVYGETHDPEFELVANQVKRELSPELAEIDAILEKTIRPWLQADGGDLQVVSKEKNIVTINYEGACGTCPSSISGTLMAIENVLKDECDPDIQVVSLNNI